MIISPGNFELIHHYVKLNCCKIVPINYIPAFLNKAKDYTLSWIANEEDTGQLSGPGSSGSGSPANSAKHEHKQLFAEEQNIGKVCRLG